MSEVFRSRSIMAGTETPKRDWSDTFRDYANAFYESRKDTIEPMKPGKILVYY